MQTFSGGPYSSYHNLGLVCKTYWVCEFEVIFSWERIHRFHQISKELVAQGKGQNHCLNKHTKDTCPHTSRVGASTTCFINPQTLIINQTLIDKANQCPSFPFPSAAKAKLHLFPDKVSLPYYHLPYIFFRTSCNDKDYNKQITLYVLGFTWL